MKSRPKTTPAEETPTVSIQDLLNQIDFSTDNVVSAAAMNAGLFKRAIDFRMEAMRKRSAAKMAWEKAQAESDLAIRKEAKQTGEKVTERYIEEQVLLDPAVAELAEAFNEAEVMDEYAKLIVETFRMRRDCLRIVGDLTHDEMNLARAVEVGSERLSNLRQRSKSRFPGA